MKNIECEIRAFVAEKDFSGVLDLLKQKGKFISEEKRLSVMCFKEIDGQEYDLRVRVTNGQAEVVLKKGQFHSHDRIETAQNISIDQFIGFVKIFMQFEFDNVKIGERINYNFDFGNGIILTLVQAQHLAYLELEKMTSQEDFQETTKELENLAKELQFELIKDRKEYDDLCGKLLKEVDWFFDSSQEAYDRLEKQLSKFS